MKNQSPSPNRNNHVQHQPPGKGQTFFWLFLLPVLLVTLFSSFLNFWSLNTLGKENRIRLESAQQDLALLSTISQIEKQMIVIQEVAAEALVKAAKNSIDEATLYLIHSAVVDDLAILAEELKSLVERLDAVMISQENTQTMTDSYEQYQSFIIMATDIASVDPQRSKYYINKAQRLFTKMLTQYQNISGTLVVHAKTQQSVSMQSYSDAVSRLMWWTFGLLVVMLLVSIAVSKTVSLWLSKVVNSLTLLAQTKGPPPLFPT